MPVTPTGLCRDCSSRAVDGTRYCARHQTDNKPKQHKRLYDRHRADDPTRALYRCKRWQATRTKVLNRDILCVACGHKAATEADHILSARIVLSEPDGTGSSSRVLMLALDGLVAAILWKLVDHLTKITDAVTLGVWLGAMPALTGALVAVFLPPYGVNKAGASVADIVSSVMGLMKGKNTP